MPMRQAARYLAWLTRSPSSLPSSPARLHKEPSLINDRGEQRSSPRPAQRGHCAHPDRIVTQNYDNRAIGYCADEPAFVAGATLYFRTWKYLCAEWLIGKATMRALFSV